MGDSGLIELIPGRFGRTPGSPGDNRSVVCPRGGFDAGPATFPSAFERRMIACGPQQRWDSVLRVKDTLNETMQTASI